MSNETLDVTGTGNSLQARIPGLVLIESGGQPMCRVVPIDARALTIGREGCDINLDDDRLSRQHLRIELGMGGWRIDDLGSRNGTRVNGRAVPGTLTVREDPIVLAGGTLVLPLWNTTRFANAVVNVDGGIVRGPEMQQREREVEIAAAAGVPLLIMGETGTGKEHTARAFHDTGPNARGPFITVNCSTLEPNTATTQLFGAKKGAHSTADRDIKGAFADADGGTLFLDEVHRLDAAVQPKLLRAVETGRIQPLEPPHHAPST